VRNLQLIIGDLVESFNEIATSATFWIPKQIEKF